MRAGTPSHRGTLSGTPHLRAAALYCVWSRNGTDAGRAIICGVTSLARYQAGQHRQVWTELVGIGSHVRHDESLAEEAEAIARETMERVRRNVERLRHELPQLGFVFANPDAVLTRRRRSVSITTLIGRVSLAGECCFA